MAAPRVKPLATDGTRAAPTERVALGDIGLGLLVAALTFGTIVIIVRPESSFGVVWVTGDLLINEAAAIISSIAAVLALLRYRYIGSESAAYQSAAFALFAVSAVAQTTTSLGFLHDLLMVDAANPGQAPIYAWTVVRIAAGALLLQSARIRLRGPVVGAHPDRAIASTLMAVGATVVGIFLVADSLPAMVRADLLQRLALGVDLTTPFPGITEMELALGAAATGVLAAAAIGFWIAARRGRYPNGRIMAAGLIFAAFAQLHFTLLPSVYPGLVTTSDVLRLCFYGFVIVAFQRDASAALRELRMANHRLEDLREVEVTNASLAERARLAREVHDGLAQRLWLAKLTTERLGKIEHVSDVPPIRAELDSLLDAGLDDARQTVVALRDAAQTDVPGGFTEILARETNRFEERTGITTRLSVTGADERALPPRTAAELLRIVQEALTNVRRHADATVVTVSFGRSEGWATVAIRDNGVGFDQASERHGYGLVSMRERAELIGGRLEVETSPSAGTEVKVYLTLA